MRCFNGLPTSVAGASITGYTISLTKAISYFHRNRGAAASIATLKYIAVERMTLVHSRVSHREHSPTPRPGLASRDSATLAPEARL